MLLDSTKLTRILFSPMEPQDMLVYIQLSFGFKVTLATFVLAIPVINSLVNGDLSFVEGHIIAYLTMVLDFSMHGILVNLQSLFSSKL